MRRARWLLVAAALAATSCRDDAPGDPDRDGDGFAASVDCDDGNPAAHAWVTAWSDADGDGVGAGDPSKLCGGDGLPSGFAAQGGDCAPGDPTAWRQAWADRDGDGWTAAEPACVGETLPDGYRAAANGLDCDDADGALFRWTVTYPDGDGDGVGIRPRAILCLGSSLPARTSRLGFDVDDADPTVSTDPADDALALILD